jgi:hypothetical protein
MVSCFEGVLKKYKNLDVFGVKKEWRIFEEEEYKTKTSATLSIILYTFLLYKTIMLIINIVQKQSYTQKYNEVIDENKELDISALKFSLCLMNQSEFLHIDSYYNISPFLLSLHGVEFNITSLKSSNNFRCSIEEDHFFKNYSYAEDMYEHCICINARENDTLYDNMRDSNSNTLTIDLQRKMQQNSSEDISEMALWLHYTDFYFDYSKDKPLQQFGNVDLNTAFGAKTFFLDEIGYTDGSFNYWDFYSSTGTPQYAHHFSPHISPSGKLNPKSVGFTFMFKTSKSKIFYEINIFTIDDILAIFGGNFQCFYLFFQLIGNWHNNRRLDRKVKQKIHKDCLKIQDIFQKEINIPELKNRKKDITSSKGSKAIIIQNERVFDYLSDESKIKSNRDEIDGIEQIKMKMSNKDFFTEEKLDQMGKYFYESLLTFDNFINVLTVVEVIKILLLKDEESIQELQLFSKALSFIHAIKDSENNQHEVLKKEKVIFKENFKHFIKNRLDLNKYVT